jgi:hypothetical protein
MADSHFVFCSDPIRLLEAAAEAFLVPLTAAAQNPFPSPDYLLALRQGGLRDHLIRAAAERGVQGWFDPPLCIFHELPDWLGHTRRRPLGDYERIVLLATVLREAAGDVLGRIHDVGAFLDAVDRLFGELVQEGVGADAFLRAVGRREGDPFEVVRDHELALTYRAYIERLDAAERRDGRDTYEDCARAVAVGSEVLSQRLGGRREIRIFGLHDLRGGWRRLLAALVNSPALDRVVVYAAEELLQEELVGTVQHLDHRPVFGTALFDGGERSEVSVDLIAAPDPDREAEEVARRVRMLAEHGTPLHRIGVVSRKARPHVELIVTALARAAVPATARLRMGFAEIPVVRSVLALFKAAAVGWNRRAIVDLSAQPYYANDLDVSVLNHIGYREVVAGIDAWLTALVQLEQESQWFESGEADDEERRRRDVPSAVRVSRTVAAFKRFAAVVRPLDETRVLLPWVRWFERFLADDPLAIAAGIYAVPEGQFELARADLAGWRALGEVVSEWREALETWGTESSPMDASRFHARLQSVLSGDTALWTKNRRGVQVLEGLAAAYRSFDHLFIVGMEVGHFPSPAPRVAVLDDSGRAALRALGIPLEGTGVWDARERGLFRILLAGAVRSVTLSYVNMDELGDLQAPSSFVEAVEECHRLNWQEIPPHRVLTSDVPTFVTAEAGDQAVYAAQVERVRETGAFTVYSGQIEDSALLDRLADRYGDHYVWSPSQLEQYANCPWGWFSARLLRLERVDDPDQEMDPATRGSILHDTLKRFFDRAAEIKGGPVFLNQADAGWIEREAKVALEEAIAAARDERWVGHESLLPAKREELKRIVMGYLEWEVDLHDRMTSSNRGNAPKMVRTAVAEHEMSFGRAVLDRAGVRVLYRGFIDRVEVGCDERVDSQHLVAAVDYKTTEFSTPGAGNPKAWDDGAVLQVPLYAHALRTLVPGGDVARVEYRALAKRDDKAVHRLQLYEVNWKGPLLVQQPAATQKFEQALDCVAEYVRRIRSGHFPAEVPPSCSCPSWCHGADICRVVQETKGRSR